MKHQINFIVTLFLTVLLSCTNESNIYIKNQENTIALKDIDENMLNDMNSNLTSLRKKWIKETEDNLLIDSVFLPSINCSIKFMKEYIIYKQSKDSVIISHINKTNTPILNLEIIKKPRDGISFSKFKNSFNKSKLEPNTEVISNDQEVYEHIYSVITYNNDQKNSILFQFFTEFKRDYIMINISQPQEFDSILLRENMIIGSAIIKNIKFY
jgi:hypothetical protein